MGQGLSVGRGRGAVCRLTSDGAVGDVHDPRGERSCASRHPRQADWHWERAGRKGVQGLRRRTWPTVVRCMEGGMAGVG